MANGLRPKHVPAGILFGFYLPVKKIYVILLIVAIIITGGYFGLRYYVLKTPGDQTGNTKARSLTDLRPAIIAKLQQLVKDGSGGLYRLDVEELEPHLLSSSVDIRNAILIPDSTWIKKLDEQELLPDDIFTIQFAHLKIEGINRDDFLLNDGLTLRSISVSKPIIEVYHQKRLYNQAGNKKDSLALYQKILKNFKSIAIDRVEIKDGTIITHNLLKKQRNQVNDISVVMNDILIDASTQSGDQRFMFAKKVELAASNYLVRSADSLYEFKCGSISISAIEDKLVARNVEIHPTVSRQQFQKRLKARQEIFDIRLPRISISGIDWRQLINEGALIAEEAIVEDGRCEVYLDCSLPFRKIKPNNFPHQMLMTIPAEISVAKMQLRNALLRYTEYNPRMKDAGTVVISKVNGRITNLTNIPIRYRQNNLMVINSDGLFMQQVPMTVNFQFNLAKHKTGDFSLSLEVKDIDSSILNPITVPMAEFMIKKGKIQKGIALVTGNNSETRGKGELRYTDLYVVRVNRDKNEPGKVDKEGLMSFLANTALVKNNNPSPGEPVRKVDFEFTREAKLSFFSLVWKTIFIGILKTIGLPESFADKSY